MLHNYEIIEEQGGDQLGRVWIAQDRHSDLSVLVRRIPIHKIHQHGYDTLIQESQRLTRLNHPAITPLLEIAINEEDVTLVWVKPEGVSLAFQRNLGFEIPDLQRWVLPVLESLAIAHEEGIVHRNLEEEHIFMSSEGPILSGFSLTGTGHDGGLTEDSAARPVPPELLRGEAATAKSDQYLVASMIDRLVGPLEEADPLSSVIRKGLAEDPRWRFEDILELSDALRQALDQRPEPSRLVSSQTEPQSTPEPPPLSDAEVSLEGHSSRFFSKVLVALVALGGLMGLGWHYWPSLVNPEPRTRTVDSPKETSVPVEIQPLDSTPDPTSLSSAMTLIEAGNLEGAVGILEGLISEDSEVRIEALETLGTLELQNGAYEEAASHLSTALELSPVEQNYYKLALALAAAGRPEEAVDRLTQGLATYPDSIVLYEAYVNLGGPT